MDLDATDPRVHQTLAYVCLHHREFERARRHLLQAVEMNPNDPIILTQWGHAQAYLGDAEAGLRTLASTLPRMLSPPRWYFIYCARALLLARRPAESVADLCPISCPSLPSWTASAQPGAVLLGMCTSARTRPSSS